MSRKVSLTPKHSQVSIVTCNVYPQAHQEQAYQQFCASKAVEKAQQQEGYYEQLVAVNQSEIACIPTLMHPQQPNSLKSSQIGKIFLDNTHHFSSKVTDNM